MQLNDVIAGLALIWSIGSTVFQNWGMRKHKRVLDEQQKLINDLTLERANQDSVKRRMADVIVRFCGDSKGKSLLVKNDGYAQAEDVHLEMNPDLKNMPRDFPFPMTMNPGQEVRVSICVNISAPSNVRVAWRWIDDTTRPHYTYREEDVVVRA